MAHLTRQTVTMLIPKNAVVKKNRHGVLVATWLAKTKHGERKIVAVVAADGRRCKVILPEWYLEMRDSSTGKIKRIKLFRDRNKSQTEAGKILDEIAKSGHIPHTSVTKTLSDYITDWKANLTARECSQSHRDNAIYRITELCRGIDALTIHDITAEKVENWLKAQRTARNLPIKRQSYTAMSVQTSNHYLKNAKAFLNFLVLRKVLPANPLNSVIPLSVNGHQTMERRALTLAELDTLFTATSQSKVTRGCLSGIDRAYCYLVAAYTGFRRNETAQLTPRSFLLDGDNPVILLRGNVTKNEQDVRQPIPKPIADKLKEYLAKKDPDKQLWNVGAWTKRKACYALQRDAQEAGIPIYDAAKKKIDFHALRTTYITSLALAGIPIQIAQRLSRLSTADVMMKHYAKIGVDNLSDHINKLST